MAALTVVFCADTYLMEIQSGRREVFRLWDNRKQALAVYKRLAVQMIYLTAVSAPGYAMFFWQKLYRFGSVPSSALFGISMAVIGVNILLWGMASVTTCSQLAVMKKGRFLHAGSMRELLMQARKRIWLCCVDDENEAHRIETQYQVSSKEFADRGLQLRVISEEKPHVTGTCVPCEATLEDAYIYMSNRDIDIR